MARPVFTIDKNAFLHELAHLHDFPRDCAHAHVRPQVIDSFLNWGDHGKPKSGKIKGRCQPPLGASIRNNVNYCCYLLFERENIIGRGLFCSFKVTETTEILS